MKIGVMQPYFMPYLGYWQHIAAVDKYVLFDDVNFIKRGWINRNRIINNGKEYLFTLPLKNTSQNRMINEHSLIDNSGKEKLWNILINNYKKSDEWKNVESIISDIVLYESLDLVEYIYNSIICITKIMGIETEIIRSSELDNNKNLKGQEKIIEICKLLNGDRYINPFGGVELYDTDIFKNNNIDLRFIVPQLSKYNQISSEFIPGLSLLDVLCSAPLEWIKDQLNNYSVIAK